MKYLVTGGAGFIGSHIVDRLLADGHSVRVLDDFSTGREENMKTFESRAELIRGSVADRAIVARALDGVDGVFHEAAIPSVPRSVANPIATNVSIVDGTLALLEEMRRSGRGKMVFASSSSIYGPSEELPKREEMRLEPMSPYAVAKMVAEQYAVTYSQLYGVQTVALRYFNVFGPRQDPTSEYSAVIPRFITAALAGRRPTIYGDGLQSRDFTYVDNVVEANMLAMNAALTGEAMNIALGERVTLLDVLALIGKSLGRKIDPIFELARKGDIKHSYAAVDRAGKLLGFKGSVNFSEGLERTIDFFRSEASR